MHLNMSQNYRLTYVWVMTPFYYFYLLRQDRKLCARLVLVHCRFFLKKTAKARAPASFTDAKQRPSFRPSIPGDEQRGMMGYSPLLLSAASSRGK